MSKRYYWIKIHEHFFEDEKIQWLEEQKNGQAYVYFWIKLLLKCLKCKDEGNYGFLRFTERIPYDDKLLSKITNTNIDTVRVAMKYFKELDMVEILDNKTIYIESVQKMIGSETDSAERVRKHREKIDSLQCNKGVTEMKRNKEIESDIDKESDIDINKETNPPKTPKKKPDKIQFRTHILLKQKEYDSLLNDLGENKLNLLLDRMNDWQISNGKYYKNHAAAIRNWLRNEKDHYNKINGNHQKQYLTRKDQVHLNVLKKFGGNNAEESGNHDNGTVREQVEKL